MSLATLRPLFEESVYQQYKEDEMCSALAGNPLKLLTSTELFRMNTFGNYMVEWVNYAFTSYCLGVRDVLQSQENPATLIDNVGTFNYEEIPVIIEKLQARLEQLKGEL